MRHLGGAGRARAPGAGKHLGSELILESLMSSGESPPCMHKTLPATLAATCAHLIA